MSQGNDWGYAINLEGKDRGSSKCVEDLHPCEGNLWRIPSNYFEDHQFLSIFEQWVFMFNPTPMSLCLTQDLQAGACRQALAEHYNRSDRLKCI